MNFSFLYSENTVADQIQFEKMDLLRGEMKQLTPEQENHIVSLSLDTRTGALLQLMQNIVYAARDESWRTPAAMRDLAIQKLGDAQAMSLFYETLIGYFQFLLDKKFAAKVDDENRAAQNDLAAMEKQVLGESLPPNPDGGDPYTPEQIERIILSQIQGGPLPD